MGKRVVFVVVTALVVLVAGVVVVLLSLRAAEYRLDVTMPNALGVVEGTPVQIEGRDVGRVSAVTTRDGQAVVTAAFDAADAPLPAGSTVSVEWRSLLGEHLLQVHPGPAGNPALPSGTLIPAGSSQVVADDVLEALDPATREHLTSLLRGLDRSLDQPTSGDLNETLRAAGPAVRALGAVLDAVGRDGPAIRGLVTHLHEVTAVLAQRREPLSSTVTDLTRFTDTVAAREQQLSASLVELPGAVDAVQTLFDRFPAATDELVPLLADLRPAAARLPGVAGELDPVLTELRPTVGLLRPTLQAADRLLDTTPPFLDSATALLPDVQSTAERIAPAVAYLRPYTPEAMGAVGSWGNLYSPVDSQGHYALPMVVQGKTGIDNNPPVLLPGEFSTPRRLPGQSVDQPWTDANGSELR